VGAAERLMDICVETYGAFTARRVLTMTDNNVMNVQLESHVP